jgi:hypothetical protein
VELGFVATLSSAIPPTAMAGSLLWWRFYTLYFSALIGTAAGLALFGKRIVLGGRSRTTKEGPRAAAPDPSSSDYSCLHRPSLSSSSFSPASRRDRGR